LRRRRTMGRHPARIARITIACSLAVPSLGAAEPLTLARALCVVRTRTPSTAVAHARADAAAAVPARVRAYDDPVVSWEAWNFPESFRVDEADNNILQLSQRIPFTST